VKVFVVHEPDGKIVSAGVPVDESEGTIELVVEEGRRVTEVNMPEVAAFGMSPQHHLAISANFKLEFDDSGPRLIRK
jgi:hypothetical protein